MNDNDIVTLKVILNDIEVISAPLLFKYAKSSINYALEAIRIQRMEDEKKLLEEENSQRVLEALVPIDGAIEQFNANIVNL